MSDVVELKIGKRGEIYTTREVRDKAGIVPGGKAVARVEGDRLIIQPKPTAEQPTLEDPDLGTDEASDDFSIKLTIACKKCKAENKVNIDELGNAKCENCGSMLEE